MKNLPIIDAREAQKRELLARVSLGNRPSLGARGRGLKAVSKTLSSSSSARASFLADPAAFLNSHSVPVSSCNLVTAKQGQTSEACTVNALCLVNVGAAINVALAVNFYSYVFVKTRVYGYEDDGEVPIEEGVAFGRNPLSYNSAVL